MKDKSHGKVRIDKPINSVNKRDSAKWNHTGS